MESSKLLNIWQICVEGTKVLQYASKQVENGSTYLATSGWVQSTEKFHV